ncbi:MAG: hypothetical protein SW833_19080 [Cyanobacteriota bacterium]|nr:hypothetical protein [Cyanobacteriota bacterium]
MPDESPKQNQHLDRSSVSGQNAQAGGDIYQNQTNIYVQNPSLSHQIIRDNTEPLSLKHRPIHFLGVILFLVNMLLVWFFLGWQAEYEFPFGYLRDLIVSAATGKLVDGVAKLQYDTTLKINKFIENSGSLSTDEKITLEAQLKLCSELIQRLAPTGSDKLNEKERIANFLDIYNAKSDWFGKTIDPEKKAQYPKLYKRQARRSEANSSTVTEKYLEHLIQFIKSTDPSNALIYDLIDETDNFLIQKKRGLSLLELSRLSRFKRFLKISSEKLIVGNVDDSNHLQERYNLSINQLDKLNLRYSQAQNENQLLIQEKKKNTQRLEDSEDERYNLFQQLKNHESEQISLRDRSKELEEEVKILNNQLDNLQEEIDTSESTINEINKRLEHETKKNKDYQTIVENPIVYFQDIWKINYIAKKTADKYHDTPKCQHWRRLAFDYAVAKSSNSEEIDRFLVSFSSEKDIFSGKRRCIDCSKYS